MTVVGTERADEPINCPQEEYPGATSSTIWDEAHLLRLMVPKGKSDQVNKIVTTTIGVWEKNSLVREESVLRERRAGEEKTRLRQRYDGEVGGHRSEGFRVEGERWWIVSSYSGRARLLEWARLLQQTADTENMELGVIVWGTSGLREPATTSTTRAQLTTTSDLNEVSGIIEASIDPEGLLERRIVWGEGPWRETNILRAWEVDLSGGTIGKSVRQETKVWKLYRMERASGPDF